MSCRQNDCREGLKPVPAQQAKQQEFLSSARGTQAASSPCMACTCRLCMVAQMVISRSYVYFKPCICSRPVHEQIFCCVRRQPSGGGTGDPIMTGFDGRVFEFLGVPEAFYNIISERHHQVRSVASLISCQIWHHHMSRILLVTSTTFGISVAIWATFQEFSCLLI